MVVYVFRRAQSCRMLSDLLVATDSNEVIEACHAHHIPAVLTSAEHRSGTDRLWEVSRARVADVYVNIQGDEPLVTTGHIETLVRPFLREPEVQVTTLKIPGVNLLLYHGVLAPRGVVTLCILSSNTWNL